MKQSLSETPDLIPGLAAALASLDLTVESELLRYRQDRLVSETKALAPSAEDFAASPLSSTSSPATAASTPLTSPPSTNPLPPNPQPVVEDNALSVNAPADQGERETNRSSELDAIDDYLESSEALVKHLEAAETVPAPVPTPPKPAVHPGSIVVLVLSCLGVIAAVVFVGLFLSPLRSPPPAPQPTETLKPSSGGRSSSPAQTPAVEGNLRSTRTPPKSKSRFFVLTTKYTGDASLAQAKQVFSDAYLIDTPDGKRIQLGAYDTQQTAEAITQILKRQGMTIQILAPQLSHQ